MFSRPPVSSGSAPSLANCIIALRKSVASAIHSVRNPSRRRASIIAPATNIQIGTE